MSWISSQDLADMRAVTAQQTLPETCTIFRGGVQVSETQCRVSREPVNVFAVPADRLQPEQQWIIRLPYGTDAQRGDVINAMGYAHAVVQEDDPHSYAVTTRVVCLRQGPAGDDIAPSQTDESMADFLHTNATVQLQRFVYDATTKRTMPQAAGLPFSARVDDLSQAYREQGEGPSFALQIACSGVIDIRDGDLIASITPPFSTLPALAQVQHVEVKRVNDGLVYKVATITELPQPGGV